MQKAKSWKDLQRQLLNLEGKGKFHIKGEDGETFDCILHKVQSKELVFFNGSKFVYVEIDTEQLTFVENGFIHKTHTFTLLPESETKEERI